MPAKKQSRHAEARDQAKAETRAALVRAAAELIPLKGLDVSLDEVCAHAGYTRGAFYVHFKDRDDLTLAVMKQVGAEFLDGLFGDRENASVEENLAAMAQRFFVALLSGTYPLSKNGGMRPYQLLDACARSPAIRDTYVALTTDSIDRLSRNVKQSQTDGQLRTDVDPKQVSSLLVALVIGIHTMYDLELPIDLSKGAETLFKLMEGGKQ